MLCGGSFGHLIKPNNWRGVCWSAAKLNGHGFKSPVRWCYTPRTGRRRARKTTRRATSPLTRIRPSNTAHGTATLRSLTIWDAWVGRLTRQRWAPGADPAAAGLGTSGAEAPRPRASGKSAALFACSPRFLPSETCFRLHEIRIPSGVRQDHQLLLGSGGLD